MNRYFTIFRLFTIKNGYKRADYIKKKNIFHSVGNGCYYHPRMIPRESFLIELGDNVIIATNVNFITHDVAGLMLKNRPSSNDCGRILLGKITIGNNVFIGAYSTILPNVKIGDNSIIAAGSVVTKDVPMNSVVGGNPARFIKNIDEFTEKRRHDIIDMPSWRDSSEEISRFFWQ